MVLGLHAWPWKHVPYPSVQLVNWSMYSLPGLNRRVYPCVCFHHLQSPPVKFCFMGPIIENACELRATLLIALTIACGGTYLVEQPRSSLMREYFRMDWLTNMLTAPWLITMLHVKLNISMCMCMCLCACASWRLHAYICLHCT